MGSCPDTDIDPTLVWAKHLVTAVSRKVVGKSIKMHEKTQKVMWVVCRSQISLTSGFEDLKNLRKRKDVRTRHREFDKFINLFHL